MTKHQTNATAVAGAMGSLAEFLTDLADKRTGDHAAGLHEAAIYATELGRLATTADRLTKVLRALSDAAGEHADPHLDADGYCQCPCAKCTDPEGTGCTCGRCMCAPRQPARRHA